MGPLAGIRVVELAGIGPGPMGAMLLADLGATVLRIDRAQPVELGSPRPFEFNFLLRNRHAIALDLKKADAVELVLNLVERADALIEGFRPGVTERLAWAARVPQPQPAPGVWPHDRVGPDGTAGRCRGARSQLHCAGRSAAFDRAGGRATGAAAEFARRLCGGSLYLALGLLAGIIEARQSGKGRWWTLPSSMAPLRS